MMPAEILIIFVILLALLFDFINGFHDASNSVATIVATGVLRPLQAVLWAAFFNFIAFLFFELTVAETIGKGLIDPTLVTPELLLAALLGAICWNLTTWYFGLPSSSSHALIGSLAGAALAKGGWSHLQADGFIKVGLGIVFSPLAGLVLGYFFCYFFNFLHYYVNPPRLNKIFKNSQLVSSALLSLTHGGNDAQKTMGIIAVLLFGASWIGDAFYVPFWVIITCQAMISLGTLAGGWRIVHTMGKKITHLDNMRGCAAEASAALIIYTATDLGVPISTTHTVTGSIAGVGLIKGIRGTHWPTLRLIFLAWVVTLPATALLSGGLMRIITYLRTP